MIASSVVTVLVLIVVLFFVRVVILDVLLRSRAAGLKLTELTIKFARWIVVTLKYESRDESPMGNVNKTPPT